MRSPRRPTPRAFRTPPRLQRERRTVPPNRPPAPQEQVLTRTPSRRNFPALRRTGTDRATLPPRISIVYGAEWGPVPSPTETRALHDFPQQVSTSPLISRYKTV